MNANDLDIRCLKLDGKVKHSAHGVTELATRHKKEKSLQVKFIQ
jgi:hypothetical protein